MLERSSKLSYITSPTLFYSHIDVPVVVSEGHNLLLALLSLTLLYPTQSRRPRCTSRFLPSCYHSSRGGSQWRQVIPTQPQPLMARLTSSVPRRPSTTPKRLHKSQQTSYPLENGCSFSCPTLLYPLSSQAMERTPSTPSQLVVTLQPPRSILSMELSKNTSRRVVRTMERSETWSLNSSRSLN